MREEHRDRDAEQHERVRARDAEDVALEKDVVRLADGCLGDEQDSRRRGHRVRHADGRIGRHSGAGRLADTEEQGPGEPKEQRKHDRMMRQLAA